MRLNENCKPPSVDDIKTTRKLSGLTQADAAREVYVTTRTWENWEAGTTPMHPGLFELFRIKTRL